MDATPLEGSGVSDRAVASMRAMRACAWVVGVAMAAMVAAVGVLPACGGAPAKFASVKGGPLPAGESWTGVYFNPVYGRLHLIEKGDGIVGRWKRTDSSRWGELSGNADGNVLHYKWKEHQVGAIGMNGVVEGEGVFVYKMGQDGKIAELKGEFALQDSDGTGEWDCVKQLNEKPDLNSVNGENPTEVAPSSGAWK